MDLSTLWRDGIGFWRVWIITFGRRYRIFDALPAPHRGLARTLKLDRRILGLWIDAAIALRLIVRRGTKVNFAPGAKKALLDAGPLEDDAMRSLDFEDLAKAMKAMPSLRNR